MDPLLDHRLTPGARVLLGWIVRHHTGDWSADGAAHALGMSRSAIQDYVGQLARHGIVRTRRHRVDKRRRVIEILDGRYAT